jgi:hypothetical protein
MKLGEEAAALVSQEFPSPVKLEFEKVYFPYLSCQEAIRGPPGQTQTSGTTWTPRLCTAAGCRAPAPYDR